MPHGTLANLSISAFVRTPPAFAERIVRCLLSFPEGKPTTILDPTAGEGDLLWPCRDIPNTRLYGVEISAARAALARARLPQAEIVTSAFEGVSIPSGSMSLVLANPPYFFQDGKRAEYRIIADAGTLLLPGGVLVAILPARSAWDGTMVNHWCRWYDHVRAWKFPDRPVSVPASASTADAPGDAGAEGAFEDFTQICVVGIRRAAPQDIIPAEQRRLSGYRYHTPSTSSSASASARARAGWEQGTPPPTLPEDVIATPYAVPEASSQPHIVVRHADEATLLAALTRAGAHLTPAWQAATSWEQDALREPPMMPLSGEAHVAAEVLTGLLDGEIVYGPAGQDTGAAPHAPHAPHLLTAFVGHEWVALPVDAEERQKLRERGVARVSVRQWQDKPMLGILNLSTGETRYEQGEAVFSFLSPWLGTLAARVSGQRQPLYRLDPADWELRVLAQFGQDKQLPNAAWPGLSPAQQHRVYALGRSLDAHGRAAIQGEPGTGKTRLAAATAARMAYQWRHRTTPLFLGNAPQPAWMSGLRRAWLKNPHTLALLDLTPQREPESGRITAYRRTSDGALLAPEHAGPRALPVLVVTPKKVTKEYAAEIRAAWPESEVVFLDRHRDIPGWMQRCAESRAPAVIGILSHSLTRAFGREWRPVARMKQVTQHAPVMEPEQHLLPRLEAVYDTRHALVGYRWRGSGEMYTQAITTSRFFCPDCGGEIRAAPGRLHEVEQRRADDDERLLAALQKGQVGDDAPGDDDDEAEPVTSKTWFTLKQRWCRCHSHARNRSGQGGQSGPMRTPLWTDARTEATQRKHPQLSFAAWSAAVERLSPCGTETSSTAPTAARNTSMTGATGVTGQPKALSLGLPLSSATGTNAGTDTSTGTKGAGTAGKQSQHAQGKDAVCFVARAPLPDSFSPYDYLYRFYKGCVALVIIDESHNGRGKDTDIAHAFHQAMCASQTRLLATGTHYGGDILGFFHYWFRFHPAFWRKLGLGWNDAEQALSRYGVVQEWTREYESDARRGSGKTNVQVSTIPAPGLSARLIPALLEDMAYLTVLDVGAHMPPRIEIPEIVPMRDGDMSAALGAAEQARREAAQRLDAFTQAHPTGTGMSDQDQEHVAVERERLHRAAQDAAEEERAVQAWAMPRHLAAHYGRLVRDLEELARQRNTAARLAKGTVPRWFATLPCDRPFQVFETERDRWGDTLRRSLLVSTEQLAWDYRYPLERRLIALVEQERAEGRRVMVYIEQNDMRSMPRRLAWALAEMQPWTLPNSVAAEDRQQAIVQAVLREGHHVVIVPYRRVNEGLNLQSAIDTIIWYEMALNLFMLDQASRRAWRLGKCEEVRIYYLAYANTAGHSKLRKLGQQSGAAAAFAGEPARGALIAEAGADQTTLARLSSLLLEGAGGKAGVAEDEVADGEETTLALALEEADVSQEETALKAVFLRRAEELQAALTQGRTFLGGLCDDLRDRLARLAAEPAFAAPVWAERPTWRAPGLVSMSWPLARPERPAQTAQAQMERGDRLVPIPDVGMQVGEPVPAASASEPELPMLVRPVGPAEALGQRTPLTVPLLPAPTASAGAPEPTLACAVGNVGSRATAVFGRATHIEAYARRRARPHPRHSLLEQPRRHAPVEQRDIPALRDDQPTATWLASPAGEPPASPLAVALPSLWDALTTLTASASPSGAEHEAGSHPSHPSSLTPSSHAPQQSTLW